MSDTDTTATLRAIGELRDSFPLGSPEYWDCVRWYQRAMEIERETRVAEWTARRATTKTVKDSKAFELENCLPLKPAE
jgi:hypothetical protein